MDGGALKTRSVPHNPHKPKKRQEQVKTLLSSKLKTMLTTMRLLQICCLCAVVALMVAGEDGHYHDLDGDGADEHDPAYDQEQFLGKNTAKEFSGFDANVSEEKLTQLVKNEVDANKDGQISEQEMVQHLEKVHKEQQTEELDTHWKELKLKDGKMDWETHAKTLQPNFFDDRNDEVTTAATKAIEEAKKGAAAISVEIPAKATEDDREAMTEFYKELIRQRRRWVTADTDKDDMLSNEEYRSLLFPEDVPAMRDVVTSETMDQLDKDKNGQLSLDEYLAGQWTPKQPGEKEPHWLQEERDSFAKKDVNKDGHLDRKEVQMWLQPDSVDSGHSLKEEARHLIREADDNRDGKLSLEEILKHRDMFAGSKATRYGEDVMESPERDEL